MKGKIHFGCERGRFGVDLDDDGTFIARGMSKGGGWLDHTRCSDGEEQLAGPRSFDSGLKFCPWQGFAKPDNVRSQ